MSENVFCGVVPSFRAEPEKTGYRHIAGQSYDTIPREIDSLLDVYKPQEVRFFKVPGTQFMYNTHIFEGVTSPPLQGFNFIDVGNRNKLTDILLRELPSGLPTGEALPDEIRIIRPRLEKDVWGLFFKY